MSSLEVSTLRGSVLEVVTFAGSVLEVSTLIGSVLEVSTLIGSVLEVLTLIGSVFEVSTLIGSVLEVSTLSVSFFTVSSFFTSTLVFSTDLAAGACCRLWQGSGQGPSGCPDTPRSCRPSRHYPGWRSSQWACSAGRRWCTERPARSRKPRPVR